MKKRTNEADGTGDAGSKAGPYHFRRLLARFAFLAVLASAGLFGISMFASAPEFPAESNGQRFAACPSSPNCVSTQATREAQRMAPVAFEGTATDAIAKIKDVVEQNFARAELVAEKQNYLRYEFTSLIFRFVDDVEFLIDEEAQQVQFRSASRVGKSDLGANGRRMTQFTEHWAGAASSKPADPDGSPSQRNPAG